MRWGKSFGKLDNARVMRGGVTARHLEREKHPIKLHIVFEAIRVFRDEGSPSEREEELDGISLTSEIPSKGGGTTSISFWIASTEFKAILDAMIAVDPAEIKTLFKDSV